MSKSGELVPDTEILISLQRTGFDDTSAKEGRLMLLELLCKAGAGLYNSHTEENFLKRFKLMKSDRTPNKKGRTFICSMVYASSLYRPECYELMAACRKCTA